MSELIWGIREEMVDFEFWLDKVDDSEGIIMNGEQILELNDRNMRNVKSMCELREYPETIGGDELLGMIEGYRVPDVPRYDINGIEVSREKYEEFKRNRNLGEIRGVNVVRFGIAVKNTRVRSFPTDKGIYKTSEDKEFDRFQETECQAIEPVAVLHTSLDGEWFFIQMYNYNGWVRAEDIAIGKGRQEVFDYVEADAFLMVIGNRIKTQYNHYDSRISAKEFFMGTRIPLENMQITELGNQASTHNYVVKLPVRKLDGSLEFKNALISFFEEVSLGYLPYNRRNILRQAFRLLGDRYDWGNKNNGRDCSSYIMYVYKTMGILLPRNADEQEISEGIKYKFEGALSINEKNMLFKKADPGAAIFMDGHVMMYIGEDNGEHFMIHDFYRYGIMDNGTVIPINVNEVAVTSTLLLTSSGKKFIDTFTSLLQFEY